MKLHYSAMSGSFPAHVACLEAGIPFTLERVGRYDKRLPDGGDYLRLVPLGIVPAITLGDGALLTESSAVLQWIADQAPEKGLAPAWGTEERYRLMEWLNFATSELHKKHVWLMFSEKTTPAVKEWARGCAPATLGYVAGHLEGREYVVGKTFTVADAYLHWALYVLPHGGVPLDPWPALRAYVDRLSARPSIAEALSFEGPLYMKEVAAARAAAAEARAAAAASAPLP